MYRLFPVQSGFFDNLEYKSNNVSSWRLDFVNQHILPEVDHLFYVLEYISLKITGMYDILPNCANNLNVKYTFV